MEKETGERGGSGDDLGRADIGICENPKLETGILFSTEENVHGTGEHADVRLRNTDLGLMQCGSGVSEPVNQSDQRTDGDSSYSVQANVLKDVTVIDSQEKSGLSKENVVLIVKSNDLGSSGALGERRERIMIQDRPVGSGIDEPGGQVDKGSHGSSNGSSSGSVVEMVIVINTQEAACEGGGKSISEGGLGASKVLVEKPKPKIAEADNSYVIDIKGGASVGKEFKESSDGERVCRICHLSSEQSLECAGTTSATASATDLIQLGCVCKDELGIAHSHCAEAWFKLKGNRLCEICGESAKNVTGVGDNRFMEEWNEQQHALGGSNSSNRGVGCWRGQPFCNFLMACLVIAFVLPWFFRVNMF